MNLPVLSYLGSKSQKHVLRPESLEGTDEEDPVSALEWDLLSTDYLLGWTNYLSYISQPVASNSFQLYMFINRYHVKISQTRYEKVLSISKVRAQTQLFPNCPEIPLSPF